MSRSLLALCLILSHQITQADQYQFEVDAQLTDTETDSKVEMDGYSVQGRYYFSPVDDSKGPKAEAAFINRSGSLNIGYQDFEIEQGSFSRGDSHLSSFGGTYITEQSGWIFGAGLSDGVLENGPQNSDVNAYHLSVGKYFGENTRLLLNYSNSEDENEDIFSRRICSLFTTGPCDISVIEQNRTVETDSYSLSLRHLLSLGKQHLAFSLFYGQDESSTKIKVVENGTLLVRDSAEIDVEDYGVGIDYYPASDWRISANYRNSDREGFDRDYYGVSVQWFITPKLAIDLNYQEVDVETLYLIPFIDPAVDSVDSEGGPVSFGGLIAAPVTAVSQDEETFKLGVTLRF